MAQPATQNSRCATTWILLLSALWFMDTEWSKAQVTTDITATQPPAPGNFAGPPPPNFSLGTIAPPQEGNTTVITGGTHVGRGLFHSFDTFNVGTGAIARFQNVPDSSGALPEIIDIFARVRGEQSQIDGTIQTVGFGNASLWFMNPNGIFFGPHAQLDVAGAATFTTATSLGRFDVSSFSSTTTAAAIIADNNQGISIAPVNFFGFSGSPGALNQPGGITITGSQLSVLPGQTLSLVGGNITVSGGHLRAPDGAVRLTSVSGQDVTVFRDPDTGSHSYGSGNGETSRGTVTLSQAPFGKDAVIDTGSSGQIQLNGVTYNGTNDVGLNPTESTTPIIVIQDGSFLVTNLPPTKLVVSSSSVTPPFPTNNDTSTPSLSNPSAVATAARPSPHQLVMASNRCSSSEKGAFSSFVPPSRDTARPQPGGLLASPPYFQDEIPHISQISAQPTVRAAGPLSLAPDTFAFLARSGGC